MSKTRFNHKEALKYSGFYLIGIGLIGLLALIVAISPPLGILAIIVTGFSAVYILCG